MRNCFKIFVLVASLCILPAALADDTQIPEGFQSLFNGKDLTGWQVNDKGDMKVWGAESGILYVNGSGGGWLMTDKEFGDFELRLEFKIPPKGNSGVALRSPLKGDPAYVGMEIQILDNDWYKKNYKGLKLVQHTGAIYGVVPPSKDVTKPVGEWNKYRIIAKGRQITVELNGATIVDPNLDDYKEHFKAHPGLQRDSGHLGLQSHDGRVEFRNIYVKPL
ncbi:MAG TPA: DUF1080 domain-containing protein [Gemmataceae bacterium]|jgi:hypothetical protein|nr:DUF1080 domain-containing protein [Gemmataceae bacterium]